MCAGRARTGAAAGPARAARVAQGEGARGALAQDVVRLAGVRAEAAVGLAVSAAHRVHHLAVQLERRRPGLGVAPCARRTSRRSRPACLRHPHARSVLWGKGVGERSGTAPGSSHTARAEYAKGAPGTSAESRAPSVISEAGSQRPAGMPPTRSAQKTSTTGGAGAAPMV